MSAMQPCLAPDEKSAAASPRDDGQWHAHKVVIYAAVAAIFGGRAVIRQIREASDSASDGWARHGRGEEQGSHNLAAPLIRAGADWGLDKK